MAAIHQPSHERTQSVLALAPMLSLAAERGADPLRLLARAGIPRSLLDDPRARVPVARELIVVRQILEQVGDPALGLEAGRRYQLALFGLLGTAVQAVATVRQAIELFHDHLHLTYTPFATSYVESAGEGRLCFTDDIDLGDLRRFYLDRDVAFTMENARRIWPLHYRRIPRRIEFDYAQPKEAARYADLAPQVVFGAEVTTIIVDPSATPAPSNEQRLALQMMEEHLAALSAPRRDEDFATQVRQALSIALMSRRQLPNEAVVARSLGITERTLRRRLSGLGVSFRAMADDLLAQYARRLLREGQLSVAAIAERLGYAESASFIRAFARWTGETPHAHRIRSR